MDKEHKINKEDVLDPNNNKELTVKMERKISPFLNNFQKNFVNFCKDKTGLQNEENFFKLSMTDQMKFNECIDDVSKKVKKDFLDLEKFYTNCKKTCYDKYDKFTLDSSIDEYVKSGIRLYTNVHPCVNDCMELYYDFTHKYFAYMVDGNFFCFLKKFTFVTLKL